MSSSSVTIKKCRRARVGFGFRLSEFSSAVLDAELAENHSKQDGGLAE